MTEYRECLNYLINSIRLHLQQEASKQILYHRTKARGLSDVSGMVNEVHRHRYMIDFYERAARDIWDIFQTEIKKLRDNG